MLNDAARSLLFHHVDPERNMARFYVLSLMPTLFGETSVIRTWGRIGSRGQEKMETFDSGDTAAKARAALARRRLQRGYTQL